MSTYPSKLVEQAVNELSRLPGIGKKTALRLALHLLKESGEAVEALGDALIRMRTDIRYCSRCQNISDTDICSICADPRRESRVICVVQDIRDVIAIENTQQYRGVYHVLNGVISPIEGIGPQDLNIESLVQRISGEPCAEVILAMPATMEGDTTSFYIYKRISGSGVPVSAIARGVAVGNELEFTDEVTLGRSILQRVPYPG